MQLEHILQAHGLIGRGGGKEAPLPTIQNFRGNSNDLGTQIILNWDNPTVMEFQKVQIFMSSTDISNLTYEELVLNGNMIVNQNKTTHTVTGLKHNDARYFKAFGVFTILGEEKVSSGVSLVATTKDIVPPATITNFSAKEDDGQIALTWTNPSDSDFSKVKILYKQGSYPTSPNDGTVAYEGSGNSVTVTGLANDVEYYFRAFTYDTSGNINSNTNNQQIKATPTAIDPNSWGGIQKIVRQGLANEFFSVGDQFVSAYDGKEIVWEVIGIDVDTPADSNFTHSMTLQTKDCLHDIQFDAPEPNNPDSNRRDYGNNRYIHSAIRKWLNSNESKFQWRSQHQYDAKPTYSLNLYDGAGFLYRLDPELVAVLGAVNKKVAKADVDGGGQDNFNNKVFLLSRVEVGLGTEGTTTGEFVYPFYDRIANAGRIKQLDGNNKSWWLRSPIVSYSYYVRYVNTGGSLSHSCAYYTSGVSPACVII